MQFKFDANQEHQTDAVEAVVNLFEGQPNPGASGLPSLAPATRQLQLGGVSAKPQVDFAETLAFAAIDNRLALDEAALLRNLQAVQAASGQTADAELKCIEEEIETIAGTATARFPNFSIEMETGTGKTYVYLRTALELFRRYGWRKFIVVVPSVAVREGVLKTLQITERHFRELYANTPYKFAAYDSENLSQVRQFATSANVEFLVMTIDSFNKASNVIRQTTDRLQGETPIHLVQAARPILILDEPQNMESELRVKALAALYPLLALRYSATHRNPYNVVHRVRDTRRRLERFWRFSGRSLIVGTQAGTNAKKHWRPDRPVCKSGFMPTANSTVAVARTNSASKSGTRTTTTRSFMTIN